MQFGNIISMIGNTPMVAVPSPRGTRIWMKLEGANPSGSIKDRACIFNIRAAEAGGTLKNGMTILDASSGNMACALALYGKILGYGVTVVCTSKLTQDKADYIRYFGAKLDAVGEFTIEGNRHCRDSILAKNPEKYCFLDQLHNWANPDGSYHTLGPEILTDLPEVTAVVGSLGSGGSLLGTGRYLKEIRPEVKIIAVQSASGTKIPGTGSFDDGDYRTPFIESGYSDGIFDFTVKINQENAWQRNNELVSCGVFGGFQTGGVYHAALTVVKQHGIKGDVVAISGDSGWKNMEKLLSA